jgi:hypothetical protein
MKKKISNINGPVVCTTDLHVAILRVLILAYKFLTHEVRRNVKGDLFLFSDPYPEIADHSGHAV